jgi:hypothetical protein|tara:strand:- start:385 stop:1230 length:846 start_codon:yes stop_codon:yes gene_type:complete
MKKLLFSIIFIGFGLELCAQDMLIYKDKTIDEVSIIEVTPDYIKYREFGAPENSVSFSIERDYLTKIVFESGRVMDLSKSIMDDSRVYAGQRDRAIKIDIAGISSNYSFITYEQAIDPSTSWEAGIIFIGAGFGSNLWENENPMGAGVNMGYKFKRSPNFYSQRMRYGHILRGAYVKPNLFVNTFNYTMVDRNHPPDPVTFMYPTSRETAVAGSLQLDFGNQLVFSDRLVLDYAAGIGYGFTTKDTWNPTNYGFNGGRGPSSGGVPYTYNITLKIGYLIKK